MNQQPLFGDVPMQPTLRALRETPAERVLTCGASAASNLELLGAVLGDPDMALQLLTAFPTLRDLMHASARELQGVKGVTPRRAAQIKAALEAGRRLAIEADSERAQIRAPADAATLLMSEMSLLEQEQFRVVLLDTRNRVIGVTTLYVGSLNTAMVRVGEVFRDAIRQNACSIIVAHNHPSGDPAPSPEDVALTREIINAGKLLDIDTLDHLVIGGGRFVSLRERGLAFEDK